MRFLISGELELGGNGDPPEWNLNDLFPGPDSAELQIALANAVTEAKVFKSQYAGKLSKLSGDELGEAIIVYETLQDQLGRISSFAQLLHASDMADVQIGQFYQNMQEQINAISSDLLFFTLELNRVSKETLDEQLTAKRVSHYSPWVRDLRSLLPHQLSDEAEAIFHEKEVSGSTAWTRLFDETLSRLRVQIDDSVLTLEEALNLLSDESTEKRSAAAKALGHVFLENIHTFSFITNTLSKDKSVEDDYRGYSNPAASRHLENKVEPEVVEALISAVRESYPQLSHRYYKLKARWFGRDALNYWDRNAPLPGAVEKIFMWDDARDIILNAYREFSPTMADIGQLFFDNPWIDAAPRPGKALGAFSHPTVPSAHPYILINYLGKRRDVMTLAHELGHGVHQILAAEQGALMSDTPLTLAETASVFGEQITFRALLDGETDPEQRRCMLASKVEDMLNTVVRQVAFYEFEKRVHNERKKGELLPSRIGEIWLDSQVESLGPAIKLHPEYSNFWCYIPHFVHTPFYVYAYAFGDCLVNALYANYQDNSDHFEERYIEMLRAGGRLRHRELLAPFNLDATDVAFWSKGLSVISSFIDQLEAM